jgi:hypothetical protein
MPDGSIVIMGGTPYYNDVWRSTDKGATWTQMTASAHWEDRYFFGSVVLPDGSIVIMGGTNAANNGLNDVWRSTDEGATWTQMTSDANWGKRYEFNTVALPDGSIVIMGGTNSGSWGGNDVWRSTDKGATWTEMTASAGWSRRLGQSSVVLPDGSIVIMGGTNSGSWGGNDVWRSTDKGATWTEMTASAGWVPRSGQRSVVMPDGSIVLMGGVGHNDVWRSTDKGATWTQITASAQWSARNDFGCVIMPDGSIVIMGGMGGMEGEMGLKDVWRWMPSW